jgi:RNA recognition motif-containing protein
MSTKVYFDNLSITATESQLTELFAPYGGVAEINIVVDSTQPNPRAFGFVTMTTPEAAEAAILALHGKVIGNETLAVTPGWTVEEETSAIKLKRHPRRHLSHLY